MQQRIPLPGDLSIDGIVEVFDLFNLPNYEISTAESAADYLDNITGQFRSMQFGFRFAF